MPYVFESNRSFILEDQSTHHADVAKTEDSDIGENKDNYDDTYNDDIDSSFRPLHRRTMAVTKFQVMLNDLLLKHKASLLLFDEIIDLVSSYISLPNFNRLDKFKSRKSLLQSTQKSHNTSCLRPLNSTVWLHNNSLVTVPVFDVKHTIKSLLSDPSLMKEPNFGEGYNVLTGEVLHDHPAHNKYNEVHTGDAWLPARNRYCENLHDMPVGLIIFCG